MQKVFTFFEQGELKGQKARYMKGTTLKKAMEGKLAAKLPQFQLFQGLDVRGETFVVLIVVIMSLYVCRMLTKSTFLTSFWTSPLASRKQKRRVWSWRQWLQPRELVGSSGDKNLAGSGSNDSCICKRRPFEHLQAPTRKATSKDFQSIEYYAVAYQISMLVLCCYTDIVWEGKAAKDKSLGHPQSLKPVVEDENIRMLAASPGQLSQVDFTRSELILVSIKDVSVLLCICPVELHVHIRRWILVWK